MRYLCEHRYVHRGFDQVVALLRRHPEEVLAPLIAEDGTAVVGLRADIGALQMSRDAAVEVGEPVPTASHVVRLPVQWTAVRHRSLFPRMEADLEVTELRDSPNPLCELSLVAAYSPPLGLLGAAVDGVFGRRVAESVVQEYLDDVRERLEARLPDGHRRGLGVPERNPDG